MLCLPLLKMLRGVLQTVIRQKPPQHGQLNSSARRRTVLQKPPCLFGWQRQLRIGSLKISNLRISDVLLKLTGKDGLINCMRRAKARSSAFLMGAMALIGTRFRIEDGLFRHHMRSRRLQVPGKDCVAPIMRPTVPSSATTDNKVVQMTIQR